MPCTRHIIVCEGEYEWAYLQRLQSFLDQQPLADGAFEPPLHFIVPERVIVKNGTFGRLKSRYNRTRKQNKNSSIQVIRTCICFNDSSSRRMSLEYLPLLLLA